MKSWVTFAQNSSLRYCPFLLIENVTFPSSISFPIWPTTKSKSYKREHMKGFLIYHFPVVLYFMLEIVALTSVLFFSNNIKGSKRTNTRIGHFSLQQKIRRKRYNLMIESLSIHQIALSWLWLQPVVKNLWPPSQKWNDDSYCQEHNDCRQHAFVTYT